MERGRTRTKTRRLIKQDKIKKKKKKEKKKCITNYFNLVQVGQARENGFTVLQKIFKRNIKQIQACIFRLVNSCKQIEKGSSF